MQGWLFVTILLSLFIGGISKTPLQCMDENNQPVDWFVLYKLPLIKTDTSYLLKRGLAYMYMTSAGKSEWKLSEKSINDSRSVIGTTLDPLFNKESAALLYGLYNDEPPNGSASSNFGHTKGVIFANQNEGVWLIHSAPRFPNFSEKPPKYSYPQSAVRFGQSFLCISLSGNTLNTIGTQLMYNRPKFFGSNIPEVLKDTFPNLTLALNKKFIKKEPWFNKVTFLSRDGMSFTSFAKAKQFGKELYVDWVAPELKTELQVETWSNGVGELPSDCQKPFHVMDITKLSFALSKPIEFKNSQDHSKWAVGTSRKVICIGDINRMKAQLNRGGGTVCFDKESIWKKYSQAVLELQPCPH